MGSGATFTMRLKDVLEATGGTWDSSTGISVITGGDIGLDYYPLFTDDKPRTGEFAVPDYRPILNGKIFDHFMNCEISYESIGLWHLGMRRAMNEIMPFYNQMYESLAVKIEPLVTTDLKTNNSMVSEQISNQSGTSDNASTTTGNARSVSSETPQTMLAGNGDYATSAADTNSANQQTGTGTNSSEATTNDVADGETSIKGYQGAASDLIMRYRESFINVDMMIINDDAIQEMFMGVWDNGDAYSNNNPTFGRYI